MRTCHYRINKCCIVLLFRPGRGVVYCDLPVCLCVCPSVHEHISGTAVLIFTKLCMQISYGRGSVLFRGRCATLCTSGFMDNVMFGRNGLDAKTWRLHLATTTTSGVAIPGQSVMTMNAFIVLYIYLPVHVHDRISNAEGMLRGKEEALNLNSDKEAEESTVIVRLTKKSVTMSNNSYSTVYRDCPDFEQLSRMVYDR